MSNGKRAEANEAVDPANERWRGLPWKRLEQQVASMQQRIAQACRKGDREAVHRLQQQVLESEAARLLAVRRVTRESEGKDTAGVDGVKSLTPAQRLTMAVAIHPENWNRQPCQPVRRVWLPKAGTLERRPLGILPMLDRCKQALVKLALEPEWEVRFEPHSYGFRPKLGTRDAIAAIVQAIARQPAYVFDADIEQAFDQVDQAILLEKLHTFPVVREAIRRWLKAGVLDGDTYLPSPRGIVQGGVLSPLLLNIALHGMEAAARDGNARDAPLLVRYGDDFVILHADLQVLQQAARRVRAWLATLGLRLNPRKTRVLHTLLPFQGQAGFDFLSFALRQYPVAPRRGKAAGDPVTGYALASPNVASGFQTVITPSEEASTRHLAVITQRLRQLQTASQAQLIRDLNPLIGGWSAYYSGLVEPAVLGRYDEQLEQQLFQWASLRHPGKAREWLRERYWYRLGARGWIFATAEGAELRRYRQTKTRKE